MTNRAEQDNCAPFWNYRWRLLLFYVGPLFALTGVLLLAGWRLADPALQLARWELPAAGWQALDNRNFWVAFLWGFWMPWFNGAYGPLPGLKRIIFRDFNGNPTLPLAIPLMHGLTWATCALLPVPLVVKVLLFAAAFLAYDILMLRFDLLQIYVRRFAAPIGARGVLKSGLVVWWLYLGTGLALVDRFGSDNPIVVLGSAAVLIAPMQFFFFKGRRRPRSVRAERVAVIGSGWSGLYAAKWLMQAGLDVRVFESSDHVGGLWRYDEEVLGGVSETTFASSSNYYMHASDYPMETVPFPKHAAVQGFLDDYADRFGVRQRVTFGARVNSVAKQDEKWLIRTEVDGVESEDSFDAVVVAGGFNNDPLGLDERWAGFSGDVMHSSQYKHTDQIAGYRRILVVGLGESGSDIAHDCAQVRGTQVYCSGSRQWFAGRFVAGGFPADTLMAPGIRTLLAPFFNQEIQGRKFVGGLIQTIWGPGGSGVPIWQPPVPWLHGFVTKSRAAVADVHNGDIVPKSRVTRCEGKTVHFEDGSSIEADLILDCTGFTPGFPFLDRDFCFTKLYRLVFRREDPTLAFVGTARPLLGSIPGLAELQSRWVAAVFSGRATVPAEVEQEADEFFVRRAHRKRFLTSAKRPNLVDHEFYAQSIARELRISVPWLRFLWNPKTFLMLVQAPWMAFKYNLRGAGQAKALQRIRRFMPEASFYYNVIRGRFVRAGVELLLFCALALAALALVVPPYILVTVGGVYLVQLLVRNFGGSREVGYRELPAPAGR